MRKTINAIGTVDSRKVSVDFAGQIEMHMPFEEIGAKADAIIEECMEQYKKRYPEINTESDVFWDFRLVYTAGIDNPEYTEFMVDMYIWQKTNKAAGEDTFEYYLDIPLELDELDKEKVRQMIADKMKEIFFMPVGRARATA
ncbi:hypothetical protein AALH30_11965 [Blautia pseudococcoides]|uniref:hypothetical protein n=1 Tax=Blautia pseudococcoides TaxID=1796616 RepID=UPI00148B21BE|nr:hypothetical protein [Blautia pseudococcoides]QJU15079.1 hypothetical protein HL650_11795 [Blautia pseudococcoides]